MQALANVHEIAYEENLQEGELEETTPKLCYSDRFLILRDTNFKHYLLDIVGTLCKKGLSLDAGVGECT